MEKVRLAFVGVGGMGQCAHLRNYAIIRLVLVVPLTVTQGVLTYRVMDQMVAAIEKSEADKQAEKQDAESEQKDDESEAESEQKDDDAESEQKDDDAEKQD